MPWQGVFFINSGCRYVKSGAFTKEKRDAKTAVARPYNKTGKHIHDYQRPRFPEQRDRQLEAKAASLGVPVEQLRRATGAQ